MSSDIDSDPYSDIHVPRYLYMESAAFVEIIRAKSFPPHNSSRRMLTHKV